MGKPDAFLRVDRRAPPKRPVGERVQDWREVEGDLALPVVQQQASRCMDCGVPFCHGGCPLGNHIPEWNDLVYRGEWEAASARLHATNNFPEFTGRVCPAPCEQACVLALHGQPVTIEHIEKRITERAWAAGWIRPQPARVRSGRSVGVVGSGPAGLAAAQQLARAGHEVTVYERDDRPGGLLRYGIPDFKLDRAVVERRLDQLAAEGVRFRCNVEVGRDVSLEALRADHDAVCLALGALAPRDLPLPGRELPGVHFAMDYLTRQNRAVAGDSVETIDAAGRRVVILGGGDTGADCLGTALRQGAADVMQFHYKDAPPDQRTEQMPWPWWPMTLRPSTSHEEGGERGWAVVAKRFLGTDRLEALECVRVRWRDGRMGEVEGSAFELPVELAFIAVGFSGPQPIPGLDLAAVGAGGSPFAHALPGVYVCGDARRGASLVVTAIWEGREVARVIDDALVGQTRLPSVPNPYPLV